MNATNVTEEEQYKLQLAAVEEALKHATGEQEVELLDLKYKLLEVISLLRGGAESSNGLETSGNQDQSIDDEFAKFQMEIKALEGNSNEDDSDTHPDATGNKSEDEDIENESHQELAQIISSLEGSKCRAPYKQTSGEQGYYNALVVSVDYDPSGMKSVEDIEVRVMFCNPLCDRMKPCSFFLDGHCKFSEEKCRYSHGHKVNFSDLQEFVLPDLRNLKIDSKCLAKCDDGLWQKATVEKCSKDLKFSVKFDKSGKIHTLGADCIMPLVIDREGSNSDEDSDDDDDDSSSPKEYDSGSPSGSSNSNKNFLPLDQVSSLPVVWEQHTKGIGSKLMEKMGHVWGQGLGKNSDGRLEPVEAWILPAGKSLDKCIEMRDRCDQKGPVSIETRLALEQDKEEQRAKKAKIEAQAAKRETVFDFLNSKIAKTNDEVGRSGTGKCVMNELENKTDTRSLNIQIFSIGEDIRKAKKELNRLQQSLQRNTNRNEVTRQQVQKKIAVQSEVLQNLQAKEMRLNRDFKSQNSQKKLTVF